MGTTVPWLRSLWRTLSGTKLTAFLMAALLLATVLASLFPQMPIDPASREAWLSAVSLRYHNATGWLRVAGVFDAYHAPWYLALLVAVLLNAFACTVQRLPRVWRSLARLPTVVQSQAFYLGFALRTEWPVASLQAGLTATQETLARHRYHPQVERDETATCAYIYAERGRWAQAGTLISHLAALFLVLAVAARPALGWQETGVILLPGKDHTVEGVRQITVRSGPLSIERHPNGQPRVYQVPLTVGVDASPPMTRTVRLNQPLTHEGVTAHLQGYGPAARVASPAGALDLAFVGGQVQEAILPEADLALRVAYQPEGPALFVEALGADGTILGSGTVLDGQQITIQDTPVTFSLRHYTIWQMSHDPTFVPAMGAAAFLVAGTAIALWVPHRRLWLRVDGQQAQMVGVGDLVSDFEMLAEDMARASARTP